MPQLKNRFKGHQKPCHMLGKHHGQLNRHAIKRLAVPQISHLRKLCRKSENIRNRRHQKFVIQQTVTPLTHLIHGNPVIRKNQAAINKKGQKKQDYGGSAFIHLFDHFMSMKQYRKFPFRRAFRPVYRTCPFSMILLVYYLHRKKSTILKAFRKYRIYETGLPFGSPGKSKMQICLEPGSIRQVPCCPR